jgi:hypothetical protein
VYISIGLIANGNSEVETVVVPPAFGACAVMFEAVLENVKVVAEGVVKTV